MSDLHPAPRPDYSPPPPAQFADLGGGFYPPPPEGDNAELDLRRIVDVLRRYWLLLLGLILLGGAAAWLITDQMTPRYEATAVLRIDEKQSGMAGLDILRDLQGGGSEVNTEMEVLRSRVLAGVVADSLQLRLSLRAPRQVARSTVLAWAQVEPAADTGTISVTQEAGRFYANWNGTTASGKAGDTLRLGPVALALTPAAELWPEIRLQVSSINAAIEATQKTFRVSRPSREANILQVRFTHTDPLLAERAPNLLIRTFLSQRAGTRRTGATSTVSFLRAQLDTLSAELRQSEDSLRSFREANEVVSLQQQAMVSVGKVAEMQAERDGIHAELSALESVIQSSGQDSAGSARRYLAFPTLLRNNTVSTLLTSLSTLEAERGRLLASRTMRDPDVVVLTEQIDALDRQVRGLVNTYADGLRLQRDALDQTLKASGADLTKVPAKEITLARLTRNTSVLSELSVLLQTKLKEAEIAQAVDDPSARMIDPAIRPEHAVFPRRALNLALGVMLGLLSGLGYIWLRETMDTRIHTREDLQKLAPLPMLGVIPHFTNQRWSVSGRRRAALTSGSAATDPSTALVALAQPNGAVLEAYRSLRTNLSFALADGAPKLVAVTSPTPGDGKSTTISNLAASLAQQKQRVLVVDGDMRRGVQHRILGGNRIPGLSELLTGRTTAEEAIQKLSFEGVGRIDLISTGTIPPNPAELLSSPRLVDLLELLENTYDSILIDTPPIANVTDVTIIAPHVDGVVLVARGNKTEKGAVRFAMEQLLTVRAKVMGTILNDFDTGRMSAYGTYGYYGGAGYASTTEEDQGVA